jgi:two-component system sensor histidine kinase/response regulator
MEKTRAEMQQEIDMLRSEIKVAREASEITADFVVKQFEQTERMLHRFQSADSERQAVLDAATQLSIIATDLDGTIRLFSKGASTLLGYNPAEMINKCSVLSLHLRDELDHYGKMVSGVNGIPGSNLQDMKVFDQFVKQKQSRAQEWFYICKDGAHLPVSLSITSLYNSSGRVAGYLFTAMDMTLQRQMERDLVHSKEQAEAANASRGDFLARMSHEIRTPMNGIIGMASLLQKTSLEPRQQNYTVKLLSSANTLLRLIDDILDFSKIDAGKLQLEKVPFDLEDIFGNIANVVGMQAEKKGLEFIFQISPQVPQNLIGDPLRLGQVVMNLAGNAVKFTEKGEIVISVTEEHRIGNELTLRFSVRDSGIGIRQEQIESLFSAFGQADDSITRKYGGTGLGLAICKQLTALMGGEIWAIGEPKVGTEFIFTAKLGTLENTSQPTTTNSELLKGQRALIVDDNAAAREVLSSMLTSWKIDVDTAVDGMTAITLLEQAEEQGHPYDVVLLDWIMPGIDGIETARKIKTNDVFAKIPAMLMVTANAREEAYLKAEKVGLNAFLLKPVYASVMYNTLLDILNIQTISGPLTVKKKVRTTELDNIQGADILLVDDNSINQEVATEFLKEAGMVVTVASNGRECIEYLQHNTYDLVLMDIQMPVMDGLEATRWIRQHSQFKNLPIIAMTAHAMTGDREKSLAAGMNEHLTKPVDQDALYQILRNWIAEKGHATHHITPDITPDITAGALTNEDVSLPSLPGLNQEKALKILNYNKDLYVKMLCSFKKNYSSFPATLRELSVTGQWQEIQNKAHTIKGVSGYIGSSLLMKAAQQVEDALRNNQREDAASHLVFFIETLDNILSSLATLPSVQKENPARQKLNRVNITWSQEDKEVIEVLIGRLRRGEVAAEEQFGEMEKRLTGAGFDEQLTTIADLIDNIEYESAADMAGLLLNRLK